jgi:hypothetical protein
MAVRENQTNQSVKKIESRYKQRLNLLKIEFKKQETGMKCQGKCRRHKVVW